MEMKISAEKHKEIVKFLWDKRREAEEVINALGKIGFTSIEGKLGSAMDWGMQIFQLLLPEGMIEGMSFKDEDAFFDEFLYGDEFEAFYSKWLKGVK